MRDSSTHCPHLKPLTFGNLPTVAEEKLEFVEHVLGVLIESRFGDRNPYTRLRDQPVTTGHSQLFANVTLLTKAEIAAHLNGTHQHFRTSLLCGCLCELCVRKILHAKAAKDVKGTQRPWDVLAILPTLKPPAHAGASPSRGSPTCSRTFFFASPFANLAHFA